MRVAQPSMAARILRLGDYNVNQPSRYNSLLPTMQAENPNPETKQVLEITDIMAILPHRYPFLLIDRVIEIKRKKRIVAIKNVTINEPFFAGHFPEYPIMPGVLIVEAIAQAGGALLLNEIPDRESKLMVFTGIERAKFRRPVVPGDQLRIEVEVLNWRARAVKHGRQGLHRRQAGVRGDHHVPGRAA